MRQSLTDLHTHILPQVDDGAKDLEMSCAMLRRQKESGVDRVMLTPHFYPLREEFDEFILRRQQSFELLMQAWDEAVMPQIQLGAEVRYSADLLKVDLDQLTLGGSEYLLLELSDQRLPAHLGNVVDQMLMKGITPVLAHVERCSYFRKEPDRLLKLIEIGALAQVSANALQEKKDKRFARACLENGLAHVIASDAHNLTQRIPCLGDVAEKQDVDMIQQAELFAGAIWEHKAVPVVAAGPIKKGLFGYK